MMLDPTREVISLYPIFMLSIEADDTERLFTVLNVEPTGGQHAVHQGAYFSATRDQLRELVRKPNSEFPDYVWLKITINPPPGQE